MGDKPKRKQPVTTNLSDPVGAFRPPPAGKLELQATKAKRLDDEIRATQDAIRTTGRPDREAQLKRVLEKLAAKRERLQR